MSNAEPDATACRTRFLWSCPSAATLREAEQCSHCGVRVGTPATAMRECSLTDFAALKDLEVAGGGGASCASGNGTKEEAAAAAAEDGPMLLSTNPESGAA